MIQTIFVYTRVMVESQSVTVELPKPLSHFLDRLARQTDQSVEKLVAQSVVGNLPPSVDDAPPEIQADLLAMQQWPVDQLLATAHAQVAAEQQNRHVALLEKNQEGNLTLAEQEELADLRLSADRLMVRKAYAWAVLRWRGHRISPLDELLLP